MKVSTILSLLVIIAVVFILGFSGALVKNDVVSKTLEKHGYQSAQILEKSCFFIPLCFGKGMSRDATTRFTVIAINQKGEKVKMYVFVALFFEKYATIRTI